MDMEGDGVGIGTTWKGEAHRPLWARSLKPSFSHLSAPSWHSLEVFGTWGFHTALGREQGFFMCLYF